MPVLGMVHRERHEALGVGGEKLIEALGALGHVGRLLRLLPTQLEVDILRRRRLMDELGLEQREVLRELDRDLRKHLEMAQVRHQFRHRHLPRDGLPADARLELRQDAGQLHARVLVGRLGRRYRSLKKRRRELGGADRRGVRFRGRVCACGSRRPGVQSRRPEPPQRPRRLFPHAREVAREVGHGARVLDLASTLRRALPRTVAAHTGRALGVVRLQIGNARRTSARRPANCGDIPHGPPPPPTRNVRSLARLQTKNPGSEVIPRPAVVGAHPEAVPLQSPAPGAGRRPSGRAVAGTSKWTRCGPGSPARTWSPGHRRG